MTKAEFIRRSRAQQQHGNGWAVLWILVFFGTLFVSGVLGRQIDEFPVAVRILGGLGILAFLAAQVVLALWYLRRETREFGLHCPACDEPLVGPSAQVAIASGHCGHCGAKLFEDA